MFAYWQWKFERKAAQNGYIETTVRNFVIVSRQNQIIQENISNNIPIRKIAVVMNKNGLDNM